MLVGEGTCHWIPIKTEDSFSFFFTTLFTNLERLDLEHPKNELFSL